MCGIAGRVDFGRDLTPEVDVARAMTDTMARRGPDAEGLWTARNAALGHRRLSVIDPHGGHQPMTVEEGGRTVAAISYSGEVYNYRELRADLLGRGHEFRTNSDTEVVLRAYVEWGESFVDRLNGMYAMAIWDTREEELLLVRDRLGIKPLYYYPTPAGVIFGSEPKAILADRTIRASVSADGLRELFSSAKTPGHAIYDGMHEVCPGHVVRVCRGGLRKHCYWKLDAHQHPDDLATTIGTVRDLLEEILSRQIVADVPLCTLLSGGLDSSTITALAARAVRASGAGRVRSFAVDFDGRTDSFRADSVRATPDAPYVHELAAFVGSDHSDIMLSTADLIDRTARESVLRASDLPMSVGEAFTSLYLLFCAVRRHSVVALSGEAADEVFGGYPWFHDQEAVSTGTFPWATMISRTMADPSDIRFSPLNLDLFARLDMPSYVADSYRAALAEVPRLAGENGLQARMREISYLHLTRLMPFLLDRKDRMSMATGLEVRVPFCDHRLVEYVFNVPWSMKTFDGREKSLLRAAAADLLPVSVAKRAKSPYPSTQDPRYGDALRCELVTLLARDDLPANPLLDRRRAAALAGAPTEVLTSPVLRRHLEIVLGMNAWLEQYDVRITL